VRAGRNPESGIADPGFPFVEYRRVPSAGGRVPRSGFSDRGFQVPRGPRAVGRGFIPAHPAACPHKILTPEGTRPPPLMGEIATSRRTLEMRGRPETRSRTPAHEKHHRIHPDEIHHFARVWAAEHNVSISALVREFLETLPVERPSRPGQSVRNVTGLYPPSTPPPSLLWITVSQPVFVVTGLK
jgi:hypothetical protein